MDATNNILIERFNQSGRPLVLDGAMGSLLQMRGVPVNDTLWSATANLLHPDEVLSIHKEYINAGTDILTTNTFRTNPFTLKSAGSVYSTSLLVYNAVLLARESIGDNDIILAGSNAPAEDCYQKERTISYSELKINHEDHIDTLWKNGVDVIWNETFSHSDEMEIVCDYCFRNKLPYVVSLFVDGNLNILSGESILDIINFIKNYKPLAIGINCVSPGTFKNIPILFERIKNWGFYLNCGSGDYTDAVIETGYTPHVYFNLIKEYLKYNPLFIGSCCGSTPEHTKHIKESMLEIYSN